MALTDVALRNAKPTDKPYALRDGGSLYLWVTPTGSKLWRWSYRFEGKEKLMSFGSYPLISLVEARLKRDDARKLLNTGIDPMAKKKAAKIAKKIAATNSFATYAKLWYDGWKGARSARHIDYVWRRLENDIFPVIGARPISEIQASELVTMVKAIEARDALDMARRALQTTGQVFRYAISSGVAQRNPAADIKPADILTSRKTKNYARIDSKDLPLLLRKIDGYHGAVITRLAVKLMSLTFVRTTELIAAEWSEFDLDAARWNIPANRMKMDSPHIVPLSIQAVETLRVLHLITGNGTLLFPGQRNAKKPMSNNTILKALDRMGFKGRMTGHGFRGVASTILHEQGFEHAHIELQLAHQERNSVSAAYNHATYLKPRAKMMQQWADYLDKLKAGADIVTLRA